MVNIIESAHVAVMIRKPRWLVNEIPGSSVVKVGVSGT